MLKERLIIPQASGKFFAIVLLFCIFATIAYPILLMDITLMIPPKVLKAIAFIPSGFLAFFAIKFLKEGNTGMMIFFAVLFLFSLLIAYAFGDFFRDE